MGGNGGGSCKLSIGVHSAHGIGHAVRGRACCHVIRVQRAARAAAGSHGEVLLALFHALFLVSAGHRMLEAGGVGGVARNGNVDLLEVHNGNAFTDVIRTVAADVGALAFGIADLADDLQLTGEVVKLSLYIGKAVDTGDDLSSVFSKTVENNAKRLFAHFVGIADNTDCAFSCCKGFMSCKESKALRLVAQKHSSQVAVANTDFAVVSYRTVNAEALQANADSAGSFFSVLYPGLQGNSSTDTVCPADVFKADGLNAFSNFIGIKSGVFADFPALFYRGDAVFSQYTVDLSDPAIIVFK